MDDWGEGDLHEHPTRRRVSPPDRWVDKHELLYAVLFFSGIILIAFILSDQTSFGDYLYQTFN